VAIHVCEDVSVDLSHCLVVVGELSCHGEVERLCRDDTFGSDDLASFGRGVDKCDRAITSGGLCDAADEVGVCQTRGVSSASELVKKGEVPFLG
jgi:hypothetical protein